MSQHPLTIRTGLHVIGGDWFFREEYSLALDLKMRAAVGAVVTQGNQSLGRVNVNAILFMCKMRAARAASRQDQASVAAVRRNPYQVRIRSLPDIESAVFTIIGIAAQRHDSGAIGRPCWIAIDPRRLRQLLRRSSRRWHFPELPAFIRPSYVHEHLAIRRPCRLKFASAAGGHAARLSAGQVKGIKMSQRGKG